MVVLRCVSGHNLMANDRQRPVRFSGRMVVTVGILFLWISSLLLPGVASATTIYSYIDDHGTPVLTDNFERIPERYRAKVQVTEQAPPSAPDHSAAIRLQQKVAGWANTRSGDLGRLAPHISGMTHYQSQVLTFGGIGAVICLLIRLVLRSQAIRFLALWCLVMLVLIVPALFFTSQDAPLDLLRGQAGKIQEKQQEHLQRAP